MPSPDGLDTLNICVRLATDDECDDFFLQDNVQTFLRAVAMPRPKLYDWLHKAAKRARTVLVDVAGDPVRVLTLSMDDYLSFEYWARDYIMARPPHVERRNRSETLERRRLLITLLRMAFPREATSWSRPLVDLGVQFTRHSPMEEE